MVCAVGDFSCAVRRGIEGIPYLYHQSIARGDKHSETINYVAKLPAGAYPPDVFQGIFMYYAGKNQADSVQGAGSTPRSQAVWRRLIGLCWECPLGTIRRFLCGVA
jgi:hypothetical protein